MKKIIILTLVLICAVSFAACARNPSSLTAAPAPTDQPAAAEPPADIEEEEAEAETDPNVVVIKEKMFIAQCNDIYLNPEDYLGKTIKLEGSYRTFTDSVSGKTYHYVKRNSPGCCGADGEVGFEFVYDGDVPKLNEWIEAVGQVDIVNEEGNEYVVLRLSQLTVKAERGAEFVMN